MIKEPEHYDITLHLKNKHGYTDEKLKVVEIAYQRSWHLTIHEGVEKSGYSINTSSFISIPHEHSVMDYADLQYPEQAKAHHAHGG